MIRRLAYVLAIATGVFGCEVTTAAQYSVPVVRDVETRSRGPVLVGAFIYCDNHVPFEGPPSFSTVRSR